MCTAVSYRTKNHYFGRTLDMEISYNEGVLITPRQFPFQFRHVAPLSQHHAIIGVGILEAEYPLYYDATNEKGLSMAGLRFPDFANYKSIQEGKDNLPPFELIPWILGQCSTVEEVKQLLKNVNVLDEDFSTSFPSMPLHWMIADREESIVMESVKEGLKVYDNPVNVLTNSPAFDMQLFNLNNYMHVSRHKPKNDFSDQLELNAYSYGMGGMGLPGDLSSMSRFVKAAFTRLNSICGGTEAESISQFFHILGSVCQQNGCVCLGDEKYEKTVYSSCCDTDQGIYYYKTYGNNQISAVNMMKEDLDGKTVLSYPMVLCEQIYWQN